MNLDTLIDGVFVAAIITIIQVIKKTIIKGRKDSFWKIAVLIIGFPMSAIAIMAMWNNYKDFPLLQIIGTGLLKGFLYSAAASMAYQQAKIVKNKITKSKDEK